MTFERNEMVHETGIELGVEKEGQPILETGTPANSKNNNPSGNKSYIINLVDSENEIDNNPKRDRVTENEVGSENNIEVMVEPNGMKDNAISKRKNKKYGKISVEPITEVNIGNVTEDIKHHHHILYENDNTSNYNCDSNSDHNYNHGYDHKYIYHETCNYNTENSDDDDDDEEVVDEKIYNNNDIKVNYGNNSKDITRINLADELKDPNENSDNEYKKERPHSIDEYDKSEKEEDEEDVIIKIEIKKVKKGGKNEIKENKDEIIPNENEDNNKSENELSDENEDYYKNENELVNENEDINNSRLSDNKSKNSDNKSNRVNSENDNGSDSDNDNEDHNKNKNKSKDYVSLDIPLEQDITDKKEEGSTSREITDFPHLTPNDIKIGILSATEDEKMNKKKSRKYKSKSKNKNISQDKSRSTKSRHHSHSHSHSNSHSHYNSNSSSKLKRVYFSSIEDSERIYWFDWLRIFSCLQIIFVQCSGVNLQPKKFGSSNWVALLIYNSLSQSCTPLFLMMSSMLLLDPKKELSFKKIINKYFRRAILSYMAWSIYYNTINVYLINYNKKKYHWSWEMVGQTLLNIITASNGGHLWYLKLIMILYIVTPIFRKITENRELSWYLTSGLAMVSQAFPTALEFTFNELVKQIKDPFETVGSVTVYYLLGYLLNSHEFSKKRYINSSYAVGAGGSALTVGLRFLASYVEQKDTDDFSEFSSFNVGMAACGIFMFFKYALNSFIERAMRKNWVNKIVLTLSDCSFGIYLVHLTIYHGFSRINFHTQSLNPIYWTAIYSIIIFVVSFGVVYLMRKVSLLRFIT